MDAVFDMGGRQGLGPIVKKDAPFSAKWEADITALNGALVTRHFYTMDEYRHAIERMNARHYMRASYFERTFTAVATLCVEKGIVDRKTFDELLGPNIELARPSAPGRVYKGALDHLDVGDRVKVKDLHVPGHSRLPAYVRGKIGVIVGKSPDYPFPDAAGHGLDDAKQCTFDVRFKSSDLWPQDSEDAEIHVGLFHGYLVKVDGGAPTE